MDSAIDGVLQSLDPYSSYMNPEMYKEMLTETSGKFGGLGIEVGMEAGVVKVIAPIEDTPAERAGIKAGDYIVKINDAQVQGKSLMEAVKMMRGPVGSKIDLTIRRKGEKKAINISIVREIIEIQSVEAEILEKSELLNKKIRDSNLPEDIRIGAIVRKDQVIIPRSNFVFEKGDLVVFLAKREQLKEVESIFSVSSIKQ